MTKFITLDTAQASEWGNYLRRSYRHDFYHRVDYHRLAETSQDRAYLLVCEDGDEFIALPLLIRALPPTLTGGRRDWRDATSVYGYAGPISSSAHPDIKLIAEFQNELANQLRERNVISVFSRLHPLIDQSQMLGNLGDCPSIGATVSLDLSVEPEKRRQRYRSDHRRNIKRLGEAGGFCEIDHAGRYLGDFEELYLGTMRRVGAAESYFFDRDYFNKLFSLTEGTCLILCQLDGEIACAGLFFHEGAIAEYHLSGTAADTRAVAPLKYLLDYASDWFAQEGARVLHLGGGLGGRDNGLLHFKRGFGGQSHEFRVWRWVLDREAYETLPTPSNEDASFFPAYRNPAAAISDDSPDTGPPNFD